MRFCAWRVGDLDELLRHPRVVGFGELEARERILAMRVEAGGDEDHLRLEFLERGQPAIGHRGAELVAAGAAGAAAR